MTIIVATTVPEIYFYMKRYVHKFVQTQSIKVHEIIILKIMISLDGYYTKIYFYVVPFKFYSAL